MNYSNKSAIGGAVSGLVGRALVQPLDVIKIRLQLQVEPIKQNMGKYTGILQATSCIYREEGIRALWKGHLTGQIHAVSFSIVQFGLFGFMKRFDKFEKENSFTSGSHLANFVCGSLSGMGGIILTHPLDVIRTRLVAQGEPKFYKGSLINAGRCIVQQEGAMSLFRGLLPNCLLITPQTGLQFLGYGASQRFINRIRKFIQPDDNLGQSGFLQNSLSGGLAGIMAKTAVYPLDLVKKRMQVQGFEEVRMKFGKVHQSNGFIRCFQVIWRDEGLFGFTKGIRPSLLKAFLSIGLKFSVFEYTMRILNSDLRENLVFKRFF